jgi:hypothetical protein
VRSTVLSASAAVLAGLALAGCDPSSTGAGAGTPSGHREPPGTASAGAPVVAGRIPVGACPQKTYTVQSQPAAGSCHYRFEHGEPLEDRSCNPGAISPAVTQATLAVTICRKGGYTGGIRPPQSVTGKEKTANARSYGYTGPMGQAEYDHLISLQLGGDPNDPRHLWVEPADPGHKAGAGVNNLKDPVETKLHTAVCKGRITLAQARKAIVTDWTTALASLGLG